MKRIIATVIVAAAAFFNAPTSVRAQDAGLAIGTVATPVKLQDLDGKIVDLAQYVGKKPVLLEFWATWCSICAELAPRLEQAAKKYKGKVDVVVVAVGVNQKPTTIKRHLVKHAPPGIVLFDKDGDASRAFDAPSTSYVVILDRKGRVTYTGTGSDQNLDAAMNKALTAK
jgi:thiol-disulfide isomerase/thioredoxin